MEANGYKVKDMRILEMLRENIKPEEKDLPLLRRVVKDRLHNYNPTEQLAIESIVRDLEKV